MNAFPLLVSERLMLRQPVPADATAIARLRSDPRVNEYIDRKKSCTYEEALSFIDKITTATKEQKSIYWAIIEKNSNQLAGTILLWNFSDRRDRAEVGYELMPPFQGKGYMHEALESVLYYGFHQLGLQTISALLHPKNIRSVKLLISQGFEEDKNYQVVSKEEAEDMLVYFRNLKP